MEGKVIILENIHRGKYFRIITDVYIDGKNLAESLIEAGLGVPYYGKTKTKIWCSKN